MKTVRQNLTAAVATLPLVLGAGTVTATEIADIASSGSRFQTLLTALNNAGRVKHCKMPIAEPPRHASEANARNFTPMKIASNSHSVSRREAIFLTRGRW